nr:DUF397 domain-containing protein [Streptomyces monashensis]
MRSGSPGSGRSWPRSGARRTSGCGCRTAISGTYCGCRRPRGECVGAARNIPHTIALRDSRDPAGAVVAVGRAAWKAFAAHLARGR